MGREASMRREDLVARIEGEWMEMIRGLRSIKI